MNYNTSTKITELLNISENGVRSLHYSKQCTEIPFAKTPDGYSITEINKCIVSIDLHGNHFYTLICNEANFCNANCNWLPSVSPIPVVPHTSSSGYVSKVMLFHCFLAIFINDYNLLIATSKNRRPLLEAYSVSLSIAAPSFDDQSPNEIIIKRVADMISVRFASTLLLAVLAVSVTASGWWDNDWDEPWHHHHHHHGHFPWHHGYFHHNHHHHHHPHHGGHHSLDHGGWKWD
ncbi:hypothetical protein ACH3XW_4940 [Acanthocheilonema viteae]